jgi:hypothetical protein
MRRARLFSAVLGFLLALAGVALDNRLLVWAAMVVLAVALGLRLWVRRQETAAAREGDQG